MKSPKSLARIAGSFYLTMFVFAVFAGSVRGRIVVSGDAAATADNIRESATLFRVGFVSDLVQVTSLLLAAMALYMLFKHVNALVAAAMVTFAAVAAAIYCLNLLNQYTALTIATSEDYPHAFGKANADQLTMLFADMQHNGYYIAAIFFGLWLLPLGYLVIRSRYVPKVLGVLLIIGGVCYLVDLVIHFLTPDFDADIGPYLLAPGGIAEFLFTAWLLVKAVKVPEQDARIVALAGQTSRSW